MYSPRIRTGSFAHSPPSYGLVEPFHTRFLVGFESLGRHMSTCKTCHRSEPDIVLVSAGVVKGKRYFRHTCTACYATLKRNRRKSIGFWWQQYKMNLKCTLCPETDWRLLDMHHEDPSQKDMEVSSMVTAGYGQKRIELEISKCLVLCCKCHRLLHWQQKYGV